MRRRSEALREVMQGIVARHHSQRQVAYAAGLSTSTINAMCQGRAPAPETVAQIADALELEPELRARLFAAAGVQEMEIDGAALGVVGYRGLDGLPESDRREIEAVVRLLVNQRRALRGLEPVNGG